MAEIKDILTRIRDYVDQEQTRAENVEKALDDKIDQEISDRSNAIEAEFNRATQAETDLQDNINTEIQNRKDDVDAEENRASSEEIRIEGKLDDYISSNNQALADEIERAQGEESRIETQLDGRIDTEIQDRENDVDAEESRAKEEELRIETKLDNRIDTLNFEAGADGSYIKYVNQENGQVSATTQPFDNTIPTNEPSRINAPTTEAVKIYVDNETDRASDREDDIEEALNNYIELNDQALDQETSDREEADRDLQEQIDGINAGQNLADIVAGLIELAAYPTEKLQEGDKVQVLVDLNHDNASTVWNWTGTKTAEIDSDHINGFDYIGKYGQDSYIKSETYNKDETNALLDTKENLSNKVALFSPTPTDTHYPTEKLVKDKLDEKVDKVAGKGLSTNDFTTDLKKDLEDIIENGHISVDYVEDEETHIQSFVSMDIRGHREEIVSLPKLIDDAGLVDAEHTANKVSDFQETPDDTHYPTEKLVKENLDTKATLDADNVFTGRNTFNIPDVTTGLGFLIEPSNPQNMKTKVSLYVKGPIVIENPSFDDNLPTRIYGSTVFNQLGDPGVTHTQTVGFNIPTHFEKDVDFAGYTYVESDQDFEVGGGASRLLLDGTSLETLLADKASLTDDNTFTGENTFNGNINIASGYDLVANSSTGYFDTLYIKNNQADVDITDLFATKAMLKNVLWDATETYADGQIVFYNRHLYICIAPIEFSSVTPPDEDTNNWTALFVQNN